MRLEILTGRTDMPPPNRSAYITFLQHPVLACACMKRQAARRSYRAAPLPPPSARSTGPNKSVFPPGKGLDKRPKKQDPGEWARTLMGVAAGAPVAGAARRPQRGGESGGEGICRRDCVSAFDPHLQEPPIDHVTQVPATCTRHCGSQSLRTSPVQ